MVYKKKRRPYATYAHYGVKNEVLVNLISMCDTVFMFMPLFIYVIVCVSILFVIKKKYI